MNIRPLLILTVLSAGQMCAVAQREDSSVPRTINLHQAVTMALQHNHDVRISSLKVEEGEHAKEVARSAYLPVLKNNSTFAHATDTEFIGIPAGSLGTVGAARSRSRRWFSTRERSTTRSAAQNWINHFRNFSRSKRQMMLHGPMSKRARGKLAL